MPRVRSLRALAVLLLAAAIVGVIFLTPPRFGKPHAWDNLRQRIAERAQVEVADDFQSGLDLWDNDENRATWSYDYGGLVVPGKLSLLRPSMHLTDYDVDSAAQIERKGLGLAFRASGSQTYQAARLITEGTRTPSSIMVERYAVIGGQETPRTRVRCPATFQKDTVYSIHLRVRGDSFTLYLQGQLVDYWSDARLQSGGVGLFCTNGERARVLWVRVSHNTDTTGKVCAFLSSLLSAPPIAERTANPLPPRAPAVDSEHSNRQAR